MNTEVSSVTGFAPYQIVFGRKSHANYFLLESLFEQSIMNEEDLPEDLNIESDEQEIESIMRNMTEINVMNMTEIFNDQQQQSAEPSIGRNVTNMTEIFNDQQQQPAESTIRRNVTNMIEIFNDQWQQPAKLAIERNVTDMTKIPKRKTKKITNLQLQQQIENIIKKENIERQAEKISNSGSTSTYVNNSYHTSVTVSSDKYNSDKCNALREIINLPTGHHQRKISYEIGEFVRIGIPKINHSSTDRKLLICKVVGIIDGELYKLECKSGILNICCNAVELISTKVTDFPELREIPNTLIFLHEASLCQSWGEMTNYQCNYRGSCKTNHCNCKKAGVLCGARCHGGGSSICKN
ncbi:11798_t:CDS:2 [Ambispora gerdemannii]|uniref:11798_t:CDS:1 n=1 Tax=Ambispora gerdemannii TaxID=144530 RepID=A0A9N9EDH4_9GLOM|nr:11798_t:CDS:2 [Ambispora gerdemannii]